jgi:tape measure domain-containing protein
MHFDNSDFMKKINETIAALEKLNEQISTINASNGLNNLASNIGGNDLNNVANSVGNIEKRFSTLGIVGMTVIQRLTNAGIDMALKIGNGIKAVGNQIKTGGFIRAEKLEQAKFLLEGLGADVEGVMERVNNAVDGTAYGLDEAAKASASFFASGIKDMDQMEATLKSVSGVAALVGSDYSSIAEIFTTVAGQGKLMTMQLRQLESRGLNAAAYLAEYFGTTEEAVRDMVTKGKVSFEDFTAAMSRFADHAKDANKTFSGSMANMKTALSRLGEAFITPAMEAAIPLFNGIREAISSFTTALKTDVPGAEGLVTKFTTTIDHFGNSLGVILRLLNGKTFSEEEIHTFAEKGYGDLVNLAKAARSTHSIFYDFGHSMGNIGKLLVTAFEKMGEALKIVFPKASIENVREFMMTLNSSISNFYRAHKEMEGFKNVMVGVFSIFKAAGNIIAGVAKVFVSFVKAITGITSKSVSLSEAFANIGKALAKISGATDIFDFLASTVEGAGNVISKVFDTIFKSIGKLISGFGKTIGGIDDLNGAMTMMGVLWTGLFGGQLLGKITFKMKSFLHIFTGVKDVIETFKQSAKSLPGNIGGTLTALTNSLNSMTTEVQAKALKQIALGVLALAIALKILSEIDNEGLAKGLGAVTTLLAEMVGALSILLKLLSSGDFAKSAKGIYALGSVTNALIKIGIAMILMASALKMISTLDPKQLATGLIGLTVMLGAVLGFVLVLDKYQNSVADTKVGLMMIGIALALSTMAKAVQILGSLKPTELAKGLGSIVVIMGAIFGFMAAISKMGVKSSGGMIAAGIGMIAIATAINILAPALQKLGSMSLEQMAKGLSAMAIAMVSMAAVSQAMSAGGAVGMLVMAVALGSLASTIERIGSLDIATIAKGLGTIIVAIAALGAAAVILAPASAALLALGGAMMLVSASFAVFGAGLIMIGAGLTAISSGIMSFSAVTSTAIGMFVNAIKMMLQQLITLIPSLAASLAEGFVVFLEQIAALAPRFTEAATTIIHSLLEAFEANVPDIIATGLRMILKFLDGMSEAMPRIAQKGVEIIAGFLEGVAAGMDKIIQAGIDLMLAFINGLANGIRQNKGAVRDAILNLCEAMLEAFMSFFGIASPSKVMEQQGVFIVQGLIQGLSGMGASVAKALVNMVASGFSRVKSFGGRFLSAGHTIVNGIVNGIKAKASQVGTNIKNAVSKGVSAVSNFASKFKSAGKSLVDGVARGIRNGASSVISATGSIASKALEHFKSKLKVNSPSKVFAKEAICIPEGVALGINKGTGYVTKAVDKMAGGAVNAMSSAISKAYDFIDSDADFNPTITPVLDLSQVKNEAGNLNSMFGTESISLASSIGQNDIQNIQNNNLMNQLLTKMDRMLNTGNSNPVSISNSFTVNGNDNPEEFVNTFIRTLDREMQMRAV